MQIRDTRNGSWYWVNTAVNACPHITPVDKSIYGALASFAGCEEIHPSYELIGERAATGKRVAIRSVKKLIEVGFLSVEKGNGRGNSNIYKLLKVPKGCLLCIKGDNQSPFIKGDKSGEERVTITTIKGDKEDTPIDNELDKEIDNLPNGHSAEDNSHKEIVEVIDAFKEINPSYRQFFGNKTQRGAAERLLKEFGSLEKTKEKIGWLKQTNQMPYAPVITTPKQFEDKRGALIAFINKERNK